MLGTLPQYIQGHLKYSSIIVGIVIGLESIATLLTRAYAGKLTDTKGAKRSSRIGSFMIVSSGVFYLMTSLFSGNVIIALVFILFAVLVLGTGESLFVTGSLTWGIGLAGIDKSGKVMTWNGIAMYAGIALGAPLGIALTNIAGIETAFIAIILLAVISLMVTY
jgi:predicted MFS family arabinose efflux permease